MLVLAERDGNAWLSARNLRDVRVVVLPGLSTAEVMRADTLVITRDALTRIEEWYAG